MSKKQSSPFSEPQVTKFIDLTDMYPIIREILDNGGVFSLTPKGSSMFPTIRNGRDKVSLIKAPEKLQKYDLPFYIRKNGQFVMHRIVSVEEDGTYTCCGDHQWALENGLKQDQMFGLVTEIIRNGKRITPDDRLYRLWVRFWVWFLPARRYVFWFLDAVRRVPHLPRAVIRRVFKKKTNAPKEKDDLLGEKPL